MKMRKCHWSRYVEVYKEEQEKERQREERKKQKEEEQKKRAAEYGAKIARRCNESRIYCVLYLLASLIVPVVVFAVVIAAFAAPVILIIVELYFNMPKMDPEGWFLLIELVVIIGLYIGWR